jgi:hypothetical protein
MLKRCAALYCLHNPQNGTLSQKGNSTQVNNYRVFAQVVREGLHELLSAIVIVMQLLRVRPYNPGTVRL